MGHCEALGGSRNAEACPSPRSSIMRHEGPQPCQPTQKSVFPLMGEGVWAMRRNEGGEQAGMPHP